MRFRPAHQSMINRRHDGRAPGPARHSRKHTLQRKPQTRLPATWKGGHESGQILTDDTHTQLSSCPRKRAPRACPWLEQGAAGIAFAALGPRFCGGDGKGELGTICLVRTLVPQMHRRQLSAHRESKRAGVATLRETTKSCLSSRPQAMKPSSTAKSTMIGAQSLPEEQLALDQDRK